jgi:phytanoyl-CoA hydroxylase
MLLTQSQVESFRQDGVLHVTGALQAEDLQPVIDELAAIVDARAQKLHSAGELTELHEDAPFSTRIGLLYAQAPQITRGLDIMHYRGKAAFQFLRNSNLLDILEGLLGPEITCNPIQHVRAKPPDCFEPTLGPSFHMAPWHQDAGVMMPEAEGSDILTCWLPLGDATAEMGCMEVIPGVVESGYLRHQKEGGTTIVAEVMPEKAPMIMDCRKGDIVIMSRFTPHRSRPNASQLCRWSMDIRYQPTGQHTGRTGHPDFIVRSAADPASVLTDHDTWCRMWIDAQQNPRGVVGHRGE